MSKDDTQLTQDADGTISIGPAASRASQKRAAKEAMENAQAVVAEINDETADPNARKPGEAE